MDGREWRRFTVDVDAVAPFVRSDPAAFPSSMASPPNWLAFFRTSLRSFHASDAPLRILRTVTAREDGATSQAPAHRVMVLDSSFNPPTRAHLHIATSALEAHGAADRPARLVLLLATQNADKPAKPAALEQRLSMMGHLANDVIDALQAAGRHENLLVDIGVTTLPYFIGKAQALGSPEHYEHGSFHGKPVQQVHLIGYDTLIRIFNTKYYPPDHTLRPLQALFEHHRLRVHGRATPDWGSIENQIEYLDAIQNGAREAEGARPEWVDQIDLIEEATASDSAVSSTEVRAAAKASDDALVRELCPPAVAEYVISERLYTTDQDT